MRIKKPKWIEKLRRCAIRKLGGFVIMPPDGNRIIIQSTTVEPRPYTCKVLFDQGDLYDISPADLETSAKKTLTDKLVRSLMREERSLIDFQTEQDSLGTIEMRATIWVVDPEAMRRAANENRKTQL